MVVIRLSRAGRKKRAFYHLRVADSRRTANGRFLDEVGYYSPRTRTNEEFVKIDNEKLQAWINKGAQLSDRVKKIVSQAAATA